MKILQTAKFQKEAAKLVAGNKQLSVKLIEILHIMKENIFDPKLKTHKLKGIFEGKWSCSVNYDLRIMFNFKTINDEKVIELLTIGSHDVVY